MHRDDVTKITATSSFKDELKRFLGLKPFEHLEYSWVVQPLQRIKFLAGAPQRVNMVNCFCDETFVPMVSCALQYCCFLRVPASPILFVLLRMCGNV